MSLRADLILAPICELCQVAPGPKRGREMEAISRTSGAGIALIDGLAVVGTAESIIGDYDGPTLDCSNSLVTPGLIDCHTHAVWAGSRADEFVRRSQGVSYQQIASEGGGILSTMRATRSATADELADGIIRRANLMLDCGTTTLEIKASYGLSLKSSQMELDAVAIAAKILEQRVVPTFMGAHTFPDDDRNAYMALLLNEMLPMAAAHPTKPRFNDVFCETGAFDVEQSRRVLERGLELGLIPKIHSDEFDVLGGTEMACLLGAASCDHLLASGPEQFSSLAVSQTVAVTMPGTAFFLGKPYANGRAMIDAGCALALGTDLNPGSSMVASMAFVMGLAVSKMKLTPQESLTAATANSAAALKMDLPSGDFCVWPCGSLEELVYSHTFIRPEAVLVGGRRLK